MEILASAYLTKLSKNTVINYKPKGRRTIDLEELKERFKAFGLVWPKSDIDRLQRIKK
jgi:hypothetical protein